MRETLALGETYRVDDPNDLVSLRRALRTSLSGNSETVQSYERALASYFGASNAIAISSGTAALSVALRAAGVGAGDEVVLTPTAPLCTAYPILELGAIPVFCDTERDTFGCDPIDLVRVISSRTKAIIETPMWGYPTNLPTLKDIAASRGVTLICDLAHAHGTTLGGAHLSGFADIACFSTHERKMLSTGEGGFVLLESNTLARRCREYRNFGNFDGIHVGLNYKLSSVQAALGRNRLATLDSSLARHREVAAALLARIRHRLVKPFPVIPGGRPNYYRILLRLGFADPTRFVGDLEALGVPSDIVRYGCRCLYEFPAFAPYRRQCPNGEALLSTVTTIPAHRGVTERHISAISDFINHYRVLDASA
ncbi:MAG TPA: aminotransferase class I/II-fold pyridoxal phosphate-dependent enzyme [Candidatus Elarobacter sp.]|nr:aminotransferase class I/II-fold pyridoxal phosphate-dependent enzyme [Candidatus Elarobacter sp.]